MIILHVIYIEREYKKSFAYASLLMDEQIEKSRDICHEILNTEDNFGYLDM